jgi:hypothetical protein
VPGVAVETAKVKERRALRFASAEDVLRDVAALEAAAVAGTLRTTGNWTPGQVMGHLAAWVGYAYSGTPIKTPAVIRWVLRLRKHRYFRVALPAGVKIPKVPGGTLATEEVEFGEGVRRIREAWGRLAREAPVLPNPVFGPLSHEEWINLHLRHAELHLSFLHPK